MFLSHHLAASCPADVSPFKITASSIHPILQHLAPHSFPSGTVSTGSGFQLSTFFFFTCQSHQMWKHVFHSDISVFFKLQLVLPANPPEGMNIISHKPIHGPVFPSKYIAYHSQERLPRKVLQFDLVVGRVEYQRLRNLPSSMGSCFPVLWLTIPRACFLIYLFDKQI